MNRPRACILLMSFLLTIPSAGAESSRVEVIDTALAHFAGRKDTMLLKEEGVLLVNPKTYPLGTSGLPLNMRECKLEDSLQHDITSRNPSPISAAELFTPTKTVRTAVAGDVPANTRFLGEQTPAGEPIKTVVTLSVPGYSESGQSAFVFFSFRWSIHRACAGYVLDRSEKGWQIRCSEVVHEF